MQLFWHTNSFNCWRTAIFVSYIISAKNADDIEFQIFSNYWMRLSRIIGYFTVGERGRFLFTSCVKQANERSEWLCFTQRVNRNRTIELAGSIFAPFSSLVYVPNEKSWLDAWAVKRVCDVNSQWKSTLVVINSVPRDSLPPRGGRKRDSWERGWVVLWSKSWFVHSRLHIGDTAQGEMGSHLLLFHLTTSRAAVC